MSDRSAQQSPSERCLLCGVWLSKNAFHACGKMTESIKVKTDIKSKTPLVDSLGLRVSSRAPAYVYVDDLEAYLEKLPKVTTSDPEGNWHRLEYPNDRYQALLFRVTEIKREEKKVTISESELAEAWEEMRTEGHLSDNETIRGNFNCLKSKLFGGGK